MMNTIWEDTVTEAFEDAKIIATQEQLDTVIAWVEGMHENYGMASGADVFTENRRGYFDQQMQKLRAELQDERDKVICQTCNGQGLQIIRGGTMQATSQCPKCHGTGRHAP